jgi:hypothetical protein
LVFESEYLQPAISELKSNKRASIALDFSDGAGFEIRASQKWRFWRGPLRELA